MRRLFLHTVIAVVLSLACAAAARPLAAETGPPPASTADLAVSSDTLARVRATASGARLGEGELREPIALAADARGYVYVADAMAGKVFRYAPDGASLEFERPAERSAFYPIDLAVQESFVYVLDYSSNALLRYDYRGVYLDVLVSFERLGGIRPVSVSTGAGGRVLVTDVAGHTVASLSPMLDVELTLGEFGRGAGAFNEPRKAAFLPDGGLAVVESGNRLVQVFSPSGAFVRILGDPPGGGFVSPRSLCADIEGNVFVADAEGGRITIYASDGAAVSGIDSFDGLSIKPSALALDWGTGLYVADLKSRSVLVYRLTYPPVQ